MLEGGGKGGELLRIMLITFDASECNLDFVC